MYHPAIVRYVQLRYGETNISQMGRAVENLKSALEGWTYAIDCVDWVDMAKATGLESNKFYDVYAEGSWPDPEFRAAIQAIVYYSDLTDKKLEDYL
jgi:hypothetical protein